MGVPVNEEENLPWIFLSSYEKYMYFKDWGNPIR
jgi:hypothetical protein